MLLSALFAVCILLNTVPSLAATTAVVAVFAVHPDIVDWQAVVAGAVGAAIGRVILALAVRHGAMRFVRGSLQQNVRFLEAYVGRRPNATRFLAVTAALPVNPAVAIFATAGALRLRLAPIVATYTAGRLLVYGWAVATASFAAESIEDVLRDRASPWPFLAGLVVASLPLVAVMRLDWQALVEERRLRRVRRRPPVPVEGGGERGQDGDAGDAGQPA